MQYILIKSFIISSLIYLSACGTKDDPSLDMIRTQINQMPGVTNVSLNGQYAQGGRGMNVCGLIISTSASSEAKIKEQVSVLEKQYNNDYRLCVNTAIPE